MNDNEADWYLQGEKYFSYHLAVVGNLDNNEHPGFSTQFPQSKRVLALFPLTPLCYTRRGTAW